MGDETTRTTPGGEMPAMPTQPSEAGRIVPFPARPRDAAARPERALFDLDDFDPGPGAA